MPTIKMLKDFRVSPNGYDVESWTKDDVKDASDDLAADLTHPSTLAAVLVTGSDEPAVEPTKAAGKAKG